MNKNFQFKLNLFDGIVLALGLIAVAVMVFLALKPASAPAPDEEEPAPTQTIRYVVRYDTALEGTGAMIKPGDVLEDGIRGYVIGTVESVEVRPALMKTLDEENKRVVWAELDGFEDVYITIVAEATMSDRSVIIDGGYVLRVNATAYVRGKGYMGYGPVMYIERGEE